MSILETLTEGIVQRDMAKEGQALLNKWAQTGLLEGITDEHKAFIYGPSLGKPSKRTSS